MAVYAIRNTATGTTYLGGSIDAQRRWRAHRDELRRGVHSNAGLQDDWIDYGDTHFAFAVIEVVADQDDLAARELHWIERLRLDGVRLYNLKGKPTRVHVGPRSTITIQTKPDSPRSPEVQRYEAAQQERRERKMAEWRDEITFAWESAHGGPQGASQDNADADAAGRAPD